jgi:uracil-DNA glycosylase
MLRRPSSSYYEPAEIATCFAFAELMLAIPKPNVAVQQFGQITKNQWVSTTVAVTVGL